MLPVPAGVPQAGAGAVTSWIIYLLTHLYKGDCTMCQYVFSGQAVSAW